MESHSEMQGADAHIRKSGQEKFPKEGKCGGEI